MEFLRSLIVLIFKFRHSWSVLMGSRCLTRLNRAGRLLQEVWDSDPCLKWFVVRRASIHFNLAMFGTQHGHCHGGCTNPWPIFGKAAVICARMSL